jgi:hypothetical protein
MTRSIVENTTRADQSLLSLLKKNAVEAIARPHRYLASRPFLLVFGLYSGTYATSNTVDSIMDSFEKKPSRTLRSSTKFAATSAVNMSLCVYKDAQFGHLFGSGSGSKNPIPRLSYALWMARDSMTIFASFNLPSIIAPKLKDLPHSVQKRFSSILTTESGRLNTAQFITPAAMQIISTPLHLLAYDLNNRQQRVGAAERWAKVRSLYVGSVFGRMGRIIPAFGLGGVVNATTRKSLHERLDR